jgi:methylenetetrahydrofolate dehydrogenase (NADP+)/methenyltetrahydrofolate cyclohydrolase
LQNKLTPKPCTPLGIIKLLEYYKIEIESKNILVVGRSKTVGMPVGLMLLNKNATLTIAHSKTKNLNEYLENADILIAATGHMHLIKNCKKNAVLIDVGVTRLKNDKKIYGDVDPVIYNRASYVSLPVGGVGPMTRTMLLANVVKIFKNKLL